MKICANAIFTSVNKGVSDVAFTFFKGCDTLCTNLRRTLPIERTWKFLFYSIIAHTYIFKSLESNKSLKELYFIYFLYQIYVRHRHK